MSGSSPLRAEKDLVLVLDFGGQYSHMISRRVRECRVYCELAPHNIGAEELRKLAPKAIVLSGGPASVYEEGAPRCDPRIFKLGIPTLGICYGLQLMVQEMGGAVKFAGRREYGKTEVRLLERSGIFDQLPEKTVCWMSHGDYAERLPPNFRPIALTENCPTAAIADDSGKLFGLQFHPEVSHTQRGMDILRNFIINISGCKPSWTMESFVDEAVMAIRETVGQDRVLCALSGGVDSSTVAALVHKAIGDGLTCIFVDHGLLRKGEADDVLRTFRDQLKMNLVYVDASQRFLERLKDIADPEEKRKAIGEEFIRVFTEEGKKHGDFQWLAQGTLYPDVIESAGAGSPASRIKSHHNVAGLPGWTSFKLLEPLRYLYKDEVRRVAKLLRLPESIVSRHPFPGPGLAVRIIGEVTPEKLRICRDASQIVEEELRRAGMYERVWQAFALVGDDQAVGVLGDARRVGHMVTIRVVESVDGMTADWARLPHELIERISNRITNEVPGTTWVSYAVSSKPPATIEPC